MLAEKYLLRRYWEGYRDGYKQGFEEGYSGVLKEEDISGQPIWESSFRRHMAAKFINQVFHEYAPVGLGNVVTLADQYRYHRYQEGYLEGQRSNQELWEDWNRRRMEAANNNQPFDEPPPALDRK